MSILRINPTGGNGTMMVTLPSVKARRAGRVEAAAFRHGKAGVGHTFFNPQRIGQDGNVRVWRQPVAGDPGQPKGWDQLAPFCAGGLADHITALAQYDPGDGTFVQALVFQSAVEGLAFQALFSGDQA